MFRSVIREYEAAKAKDQPVQDHGIFDRKLIENDGRVCWLYPDGSHRGISPQDVSEINAMRVKNEF